MISVTQVLDYFTEPDLLAWFLREGKAKCERISTEAKRVGSLVDAMIQSDLRGHPVKMPSLDDAAAQNCWSAWQTFKRDHPEIVQAVTGIQTELTDGEIVGHPDLIVEQTNRWGIIDIKTSKAIQPKYWVQTGAYSDLKQIQRMEKWVHSGIVVPPRFLGILRLDKISGGYEYKELTDEVVIKEQIHVFNAYATCFQHGQKIREIMRQLAEAEALDVS